MQKTVLTALVLASLALTACGGTTTPPSSGTVTPPPAEPVKPPSGMKASATDITISAGDNALITFTAGEAVTEMSYIGGGELLAPDVTFDWNTGMTIKTAGAGLGTFTINYTYTEGGVRKPGETITVHVAVPSGRTTPTWLPTTQTPAGPAGSLTPLSWIFEPIDAQEEAVARLVNEVRSQGTLNGVPALAGSCVEGTFKPGTLPTLTYNVAAGIAARRHATYLAEVTYSAHDQFVTDSPYFYGVTPTERYERARKDAQLPISRIVVSENAAAGHQDAEAVMRAWIHSYGHCLNLFDPRTTSFGVGHAISSFRQPGSAGLPHSWVQIFAKDQANDLMNR